jgi:hypothetical protein
MIMDLMESYLRGEPPGKFDRTNLPYQPVGVQEKAISS